MHGIVVDDPDWILEFAADFVGALANLGSAAQGLWSGICRKVIPSLECAG